ncbi:hypothetical protein C5167_027747 [Papaver somniferum]|nr:hypothetical protein C5167_027747 [Papaver somniferum]
MAQIHKLQGELEVKCHADKLYTTITRDASSLPKYLPQIIHKCQVFPEDGEIRVGSIFVRDYFCPGLCDRDTKGKEVCRAQTLTDVEVMSIKEGIQWSNQLANNATHIKRNLAVESSCHQGSNNIFKSANQTAFALVSNFKAT